MEVKVKRLSKNAVIPVYATPGSAGLDFTATSYEYKQDIDCHVFGTGIAMEIPKGYVGLCFPRSSIRKIDLQLTNAVGVIDSDYRGEVMASFKNRDFTPDVIAQLRQGYEVGDRIFQMIIIPYPKIEFVEVEELSSTERGEGGHGSTGS